jgi:hypothetical protein
LPALRVFKGPHESVPIIGLTIITINFIWGQGRMKNLFSVIKNFDVIFLRKLKPKYRHLPSIAMIIFAG